MVNLFLKLHPYLVRRLQFLLQTVIVDLQNVQLILELIISLLVFFRFLGHFMQLLLLTGIILHQIHNFVLINLTILFETLCFGIKLHLQVSKLLFQLLILLPAVFFGLFELVVVFVLFD